MPMATKPGRVVTFSEELPPQSQETPWSCGLASSNDKLNMLYLYYHNDYGYQTWQGSSIEWRMSFSNVRKSLNDVLLQGHVTNYICYISTTTKPLAINLSKVVSYYKMLPPKKSDNPLNVVFWDHVTNQKRFSPSTVIPEANKAAYWPRVRAPNNKITWGL